MVKKNIPIKEAIIDTPRQTYATGVFDNADTNKPKLKPAIIDITTMPHSFIIILLLIRFNYSLITVMV